MFLYTAQNPTLERAREISGLLLDQYDAGLLEKNLCRLHGSGKRPEHPRPLDQAPAFPPDVFCPTGKGEEDRRRPLNLSHRFSVVLDGIMRSYLTGFIYSALIDSFCSEQQARMTAMDSANRNAEELLGSLSLEYNRVRQAAITQEITEVSAGARAQRKTSEKKVQTT